MQLAIISSPILKESLQIFGIYMFWSLAHVATVELFSKFCTPKSLYEYFFVALYNEPPQCRILSWIQDKSRTTTHSISATLLTWTSKFVISNVKLE